MVLVTFVAAAASLAGAETHDGSAQTGGAGDFNVTFNSSHAHVSYDITFTTLDSQNPDGCVTQDEFEAGKMEGWPEFGQIAGFAGEADSCEGISEADYNSYNTAFRSQFNSSDAHGSYGSGYGSGDPYGSDGSASGDALGSGDQHESYGSGSGSGDTYGSGSGSGDSTGSGYSGFSYWDFDPVDSCVTESEMNARKALEDSVTQEWWPDFASIAGFAGATGAADTCDGISEADFKAFAAMHFSGGTEGECSLCADPTHNCKCSAEKGLSGVCGPAPFCYDAATTAIAGRTAQEQCDADSDVWCGPTNATNTSSAYPRETPSPFDP